MPTGRQGYFTKVLKVNTKQERSFVVLDDPVPAGFKILNLSFATESREDYKDTEVTKKGYSRYSWWGSFNHFEKYDNRVLAFADNLNYGEHYYRYLIRAVTPGKFMQPPANIEEMYDPDVFGYCGQQYVEIKK